MESGYTVERADLRAWARQVERGSENMQSAHAYIQSQVTDTDFGEILDPISQPYEEVLRDVRSILEFDHERLSNASIALSAAERAYKSNEGRSSNQFASLDSGDSGTVDDDGEARGFSDISSGVSYLEQPKSEGITLPDVSFGFALDRVCDLVELIGGPDPREVVAKYIAGNPDKAAMQAQAWEAIASCTAAVKANLASGQQHITLTWSGDGANAAERYYRKWLDSLGEQSRAMQKTAEHLRDAVDNSVKVAQVVADIITTVCNIAQAALTNAFIPGYGQWMLVRKAKEAVRLILKAMSVLKVYWSFLKTVVDTFDVIISSFDFTELPPSPKAVRNE